MPVLIYSLEMARQRLGLRMRSQVDDPGELQGLPISIEDDPRTTIEEICAQAQIEASRGRCRCLVVDYLQLIDSSDRTIRNSNDRVSSCSKRLMRLALKSKIAVVLLSQLSREVEKRSGTDAVPRLSDLRDSGSIEQDARVVWMLHRKIEATNPHVANRGMLFVRKDTNGPLAELQVDWSPNRYRYIDTPR